MSKRNIAYIKPEEPKFLRELKAQAGYIEPDTIETKRESLPGVTDEDVEDKDEEQPVVVVLKPGDLSAEEVAQLQVKEQEEKEQAPADLSQSIVFRPPESKRAHEDDAGSGKRRKSKAVNNKTLLSFDEEEHDDS